MQMCINPTFNGRTIRFVFLLVFILLFVFSPSSSLAALLKVAQSSTSSFAEDMTSETKHQLSINGKILKYTARAGFLPIRDQFNETKALFFYIAYTLDEDESKAQRPVTFAWNGGPGSASSLLHLGMLGPRRAKSLSEYATEPPPYQLVDNKETWLRFTDLVMVDPIGTGYSFPLKPEYGKMFWGVDQDLNSIAEFIRIYLTHYDCLNAPVFLTGESYGTFRAAGVAEKLLEKRISLKGIILISTVLNMQARSDMSLALLFPSYTATAFYHKKLSPELQADFGKTLQQAEAWAESDYVVTLMKGDRLSSQERQEALKQYAHLTGLDPKFIEKKNLRLNKEQFSPQLLLSEKMFVGHYDSRITGKSGDQAGPYDPTKDPSLSSNGISSLIVPYIRSELGFKIDRPYQGPFGGFWPPSSTPRGDWMAYRWDWGSLLDNKLDKSSALARAMRRNANLRVFAASGYYDLATPYFATEFTFSQMGLEPELRGHIIHKTYPGGHMMYLVNDIRSDLTQDIAAFYKNTLEEKEKQNSVPNKKGNNWVVLKPL